MFVSYFSPLAPAAVLLLSAFILSAVVPRLPAPWRERTLVQEFLGPGLVGLAILTLLGMRLTLGGDATGSGLETLSSWQFMPQTGGALTIRADEISLPFLILALLVLLVVALLTSPLAQPATERAAYTAAAHLQRQWRLLSIWLVVGAGACLLFVAANVLTLGYALLAFDVLLAIYWLRKRQSDRAIARLFLAVFTASAFVLIGIFASATAGASSSHILVGIALWLRLGFYPFVEMAGWRGWTDEERLAYVGLSLAVGIYLIIRVLSTPLPDLVLWLTGLMMLFSGLLTWLSNRTSSWLIYLVVTEILFLNVVVAAFPGEVLPFSQGGVTATALTLILSLIALWVTPQLGRPTLGEKAWLWPYLPAVTATLTLLGLPLFLGWGMRTLLYQALFTLDSWPLIGLLLLAEMLALSGLVRYWLALWHGENGPHRQLAIGVVVMVPFLIPGVAPLILERITGLALPSPASAATTVTLLTLGLVLGGAVALTHFRERLLAYLPGGAPSVTRLARLGWLWPQSRRALSRLGKLVLRLDVIFQGQHYVGWAIFAVLVGMFMIILRI